MLTYRWNQHVLFTTIKIFSVAGCGVKLQLGTSYNNESAFMLFTFIILWKRQVCNMDIYLQPLINELQLLWT
jgi:hypothetical protein